MTGFYKCFTQDYATIPERLLELIKNSTKQVPCTVKHKMPSETTQASDVIKPTNVESWFYLNFNPTV